MVKPTNIYSRYQAVSCFLQVSKICGLINERDSFDVDSKGAWFLFVGVTVRLFMSYQASLYRETKAQLQFRGKLPLNRLLNDLSLKEFRVSEYVCKEKETADAPNRI